MARSLFCGVTASLVALTLSCVAVQATEVDPEIIAAQTGTWLVAPLNGKPGCSLTFTKDGTIGGFVVTGADSCGATLPGLTEVNAWNFDDGGLVLIDSLRNVKARFHESEGSPWQTQGDPAMALVLPPGDIDRLPTQASLSGTWVLKRPAGEVLCTLTLKASTTDGEDGSVSPVGDCAATVTKLKLAYWQINTFDVTLMAGDGGTLGFTMTADGNFEKIKEEGGKPLLMVRQ